LNPEIVIRQLGKYRVANDLLIRGRMEAFA
jgi:hypothetical protein